MKPKVQILAFVLLIGTIFSFIFSFISSNRTNAVYTFYKPSNTNKRSIVPTLAQNPVHFVDEKLRSLARAYRDHEFIHPNAKYIRGKKAYGAKMRNVREMAQVADVMIDINRPCGGNGGHNQSLVVLMYNKASDVDRRYAIRRTYGSALRKNQKTEIYFLVANDGDSFMQAQLEVESRLYNDIIQINFAETYYNLTLKTISAIRWTALNCPAVKYMLKLDSDCFLRLNPILAQIEHLKADKIIGRYRNHTHVNRNKKSKWYIDPLYYPYKFYSQYLPGTFMIPGQFVGKIYQAIVSHPTTNTIPALPYEDVYMGLLTEKAKLPMGEFSGIFHMTNESQAANLKNKSILWGEFDIKQLEKLWKLFGVN